jgi:hypothetical protein
MDTPNFVLNADPLCVNAAIDQDKIGWQNFVEGKIAKRGDQLEHYQTQFSKQMVDRWTSGLITRLLELTHGMWKNHNVFLHAVDDQGLPVQCALELETSIHSEFQQGTNGLA